MLNQIPKLDYGGFSLIEYLLSKNNYIIGSHFSTFTETAWWLGGCTKKHSFRRQSPRRHEMKK